jgi:hypothetical protein
MKVEKDRPGRVREFATNSQVALIRATSLDGRVRIKLEPPAENSVTSFRPTHLMERVSLAIEAQPGLSKRAVRETVGGKAKAVDLALEILISEYYVDPRRDGQATRHHSLKPYHEDSDTGNRVPVSQPCPDRVPDTGVEDRVPVSPPLRTRDTGHGPTDTPHTTKPDPACVCNGTWDERDEQGRCSQCFGWPESQVV